MKFYDELMKGLTARGGVETRCFETETRRDFAVAKPRRDTRLYISCFSLSQSCGVRVGNRSRIFSVGVGKLGCLNMLKSESLF